MTCRIERVATIDYRLEPYDWTFAREEAAKIDAHWATVRAKAPATFDGRVLVAHRVTVAEGRVTAAGFETGYKPFLYWREAGFPGAPVFNLFAMAALRSADGAFMLGQMSAGTTSPGRLYFPAGTPEPSDLRDSQVDLAGNALRELEEETGLAADQVAVAPGWTLVVEKARVACMRAVQSSLDADALIDRVRAFNALQADPELAGLVAVRSRSDFDESRMPGFMLAFLADALP